MVDRMLPCLPQEAIHALLPVKLDRITRPSLEELNAVLFTNGKIYNRPQSSDFMKAYLLDEFFRQVEPAAIQVTTKTTRCLVDPTVISYCDAGLGHNSAATRWYGWCRSDIEEHGVQVGQISDGSFMSAIC